MKNLFLFCSLLFTCPIVFGQGETIYTPEDKVVFEKYTEYIQEYRQQSLETVLEKTAEFFLGAPYVAHTLEVSDKEQLVINLREFDCVTYIETVIALAQTAKSNVLSFDAFANELEYIRYWTAIENYASRLHYTSDWVWQNELKGIVKNLSKALGGVKETKEIRFMSSHRSAYKQLKSDDSMVEKIKLIEDDINSRQGFYYLPKNSITAKASQIPHMAMIGFTTSIEGLDTTHTGFAYKKNGKLTFIHASSAENKVVIDKKSLSDYCALQKSCTGVIIAEVQ